mmetsp:Transcript_26681/g.48059  ORF Transcript_26681/g.48059 Transcript_26681/m.48059 type:complete len:665 (-) Transcript_26681:1697-3691(-)
MKSVSELLLHLDSLTNVCLPQQGLYILQLTLEQQKQHLPPLRVQRKEKQIFECYDLKPPLCTDTDAFSSCFFIRYAEEDARLQQVYTYRLASRSDIKLTVRLLFRETNRFCNLSQAKLFADSLTLEDFEEVSNTTVSISCLGSSFHEYVAALMPEPQLAVVNMTLHSALVEYRLPNTNTDIVEQWSKAWFEECSSSLSQHSVKAVSEKHLMQLVLSGDKLKGFLCALAEEEPKVGKLAIPTRPCLDICPSPWSTEELKSQLCAKLEGKGSYEAAECLLQVCLQMSSYIIQLSDTLERALVTASGKVCSILKQTSLIKMKSAFSYTLCKNILTCTGFVFPADLTMPSKHTSQAKALRKRLTKLPIEMNVMDINMFEPLQNCPVFFEDCLNFQGNPAPPPPYSGVHLIVLVHGFQGSAFDFKRFKNYLTIFYPEALTYCSSCNEGDTGNSIEMMGERLSIEVFNYVEEWVKGDLAKLSFIGHSIGGLIIRSALPHFGSLRERMHSFISLSSPHLGCLYSNSMLIDFGLKLFRSWNKCISLSQLTFQDAEQIEESFLYRLSCYPGLSWFRNVVLLSSCQDQYVPYDSARNEIPAKAFKDQARGKQIAQMVDNLSSMLTCPQLLKIDVHFKIKQKSLDSVIGRAAHIQFIDDAAFIRQFLVSYPELFN